jgi:hypothetical protein
MPRTKLTKSVIDALPTPAKDVVYYEIKKRDVIEVVSGIEHRGAPIAANKANPIANFATVTTQLSLSPAASPTR